MRGRLRYLDVLATQAAQAPSAPIAADGAGWVSRRGLWDAAQGVAAELLHRDVAPGDRVVAAMEPSVAHLVVLLGGMLAGAVVCPLNVKLAPVEARRFLAGLDPRLVVAEPALLPLVDLAGAELLTVTGPQPFDGGTAPPPPTSWGGDEFLLPGDRALTDRLGLRVGSGRYAEAVEERIAAIGTDAPAIVFGTGGTTGTPKAATWSHGGLWLYAASCALNQEVRPTDVELFFTPFFHIALVTCSLSTLYAGGRVVVLPRFDPDRVLAAFRAGGITRCFAPPTALTALTEARGFDVDATRAVRRVLYGGTGSPPAFAQLMAEAFPAAELITGYGATEFGAVARIRSWERAPGRDVGLGGAVPGALVHTVDDDGRRLPDGEEGEIAVSAPWQMLGYWGDEMATAAAMTREGAIRSGDLGRVDDRGHLHLTGRRKDMIITGAENVFPAEVEQVLACHPAVRAVAVYGVDDPHWGERVEAAVVVEEGCTLTLDDVRAHCDGMLARYKVPKVLRVLEALPLTPAMKVDRRRLSEVGRGD